MQQINQLKKGLSVLDLTHRLSRVCCCAQNLHHAITSPAQERNDLPFSTRHATKDKLANNKSTDTLTAGVKLASTSAEVDFVDVSERCIRNCRHVISWKKKTIYFSTMILFSADDRQQQFGSTQQWRTASTNSASSTDKTNALQQPADQQRKSESYNAANLSGSSALEQKDPKPLPQPPDPETCCESGCVNCVWIRYVQELMDHSPDDKEQIKKVLDLIEDYNVKMFVKMELDL